MHDRIYETQRGRVLRCASAAAVTRLIDVRLHNVSQLAGFAKRDDLRYFLERICGIEYVHQPALAPTDQVARPVSQAWRRLGGIRGRLSRSATRRKIESTVSKELFGGVPVLLCSEFSAIRCHRRLVAEYLERAWGDVAISHLC